jgi:hypothetical protein
MFTDPNYIFGPCTAAPTVSCMSQRKVLGGVAFDTCFSLIADCVLFTKSLRESQSVDYTITAECSTKN